MGDRSATIDQMRQSIVEIAVETWRFRGVFQHAMAKLDAGDSARYTGQYTWLIKKINAALESVGFHIVNAEGQYYDVGMAVPPLNIEEFGASDRLYVAQMLEPIVMHASSVVKTGTVMLGRVSE